MFGSVTNQVSGLGSSLGSWFKKENKEGEEPVDGEATTETTAGKEETTKTETKEKPPSKTREGNDETASNHSG